MINALILSASMFISGPDFEIPRQNLYILVDNQSKDVYIKRRSRLVSEIQIRDPQFFPAQIYYIHKRYNIVIKELVDNQREKYKEIPAFRFSKNGEWETFCDGTFAADGMFTISLYSILRWEEFEQEVFEIRNHRNINQWYILPPIYPADFIKHFRKSKQIEQMNISSYRLNGLELPEWMK